jgi:non-ribosomal peptide synthetase component F
MTFSTKNNFWRMSKEYLEEIYASAGIKKTNLDFSSLASNLNQLDWLWNALEKNLTYSFMDYADKKSSKIAINGKGNIIEKIIDINLENKPNANITAMIYENSEADPKEITFEELNKQICKVVNGLKDIGFKKGDVALIAMPTIPEAIFAYLGVIKMGGVCVPVFDGSFETDKLAKVIKETQPKIIFTLDTVQDNDSVIILKNNIDSAVKNVASVEIVIVINSTGEEIGWKINRDVWWEDLIDNQQLEEPVDTINTSEPYMVMILDVTNDKLKQGTDVGVNEIMTYLSKHKDFASFYLLMSLMIYANLEESIKVK